MAYSHTTLDRAGRCRLHFSMDMIQAAIPQVVQQRDALAIAADVAVVLTGVAVIILGVVTMLTLLELRSTFREVRSGIRDNFGPVSKRARRISDNVEVITDRLRTDVGYLTDSVRALSDRLQQASNHMEDRIEEFNLLMEAVQGEAEDIFLDTAATAHGIREGARSISNPKNDLEDSDEVLPHPGARVPAGSDHSIGGAASSPRAD